MTTTPPDDRIRTKIESLLRLAEDPGATADERANAMDRVAALMAKYQIDASRLDPHSGQYMQEEIVMHTFDIPSSYGLSDIRHHGLYQVVQAMGADGYAIKKWAGRRYRREGLRVHATESTLHTLRILIPSLILQETAASAAYIARTKQEDSGLIALRKTITAVRDAGGDAKACRKEFDAIIRSRRKGFCGAFYVEAAHLIKERRKDAVQEAGRGYDLVVVDTADRIRQSLADLDLSTRKIRRDTRFSVHGWENGTRAGRQALVGQTELHGGRLELGR